MAARPDLNGLRVKSPAWGAHQIYLIDEGKRRYIPDPPTYEGLFRTWDGIIYDIDINDIDLGNPLKSGAILAKALNGDRVYLVDGNLKRWITSPDAMDRYYFDWNKVKVVDPALLNPIPDGNNIDA